MRLFVQNRFLNIFTPQQYAWRWNGNKSPVRLDPAWTNLRWDLEPVRSHRPHEVSISSRQVQSRATQADVAAARSIPMEKRLESLTPQAGPANATQAAALTADLTAAADRLRNLESQLKKRDLPCGLEMSTRSATARLQSLEAELRARMACGTETAATQQALVSELRIELQRIRRDFKAVSHRQQLVARQVSVLQFGPGDPEKPRLDGEHHSFSLIYYQGRRCGLRKPFDTGEFQQIQLLLTDGSNRLLSGYLPDGVRARIDILEDTRVLDAALVALCQQVLATDSPLADGLLQINAALQANVREFERLARNWPNWMLGRFSK